MWTIDGPNAVKASLPASDAGKEALTDSRQAVVLRD
jgi:hypothetical protein